MNPDLGAMAFGIEETYLGAIDLSAELSTVDFGAELLPYKS